MEKQNYKHAQIVSHDDLNKLQDNAEKAIDSIAKNSIGKGIANGFNVSIAGEILTIFAGAGYDSLGRTIRLAADMTVDLSTIVRPTPTNYKWVAIALVFNRVESDERQDINGDSFFFSQAEAVSINIVEGENGAQEAIDRPDAGQDLLIADILFDNASPLADLQIDKTRVKRFANLVDLTNQFHRFTVTYDDIGPLVYTWSELGLPNGDYAVSHQLIGNNTRYVRHVSMKPTQNNLKIWLYHDTSPSSYPVLGAPHVTFPQVIGDFVIGGREKIIIEVNIRRRYI